MERAAGWYKRRTQKMLLCLGLLVAVGMNVDSIHIALTLWNNPVARQAAIDVAQEFAKKNAVQASDKSEETAKNIKDQLDNLTKVDQSLPVPFGWQAEMATNAEPFHDPFSNKVFWSEKLIGWVITALALSLGAPFWFDTLNKFMSARSAIKPKEDTKGSS